MSRKEYITPPNFDPHADAIDDAPDPWSTTRRVHTEPIKVQRLSIPVDASFEVRRSRHVAAWVAGVLFVAVLVLLVVAMVWSAQ